MAQLRWKEVSSEIAKKNIEVCKEVVREGNLFFVPDKKINKKSHLLNCKCDTFVNITSPTQLQDGTTYDSINITHHNYMKSTKNYSSKTVNFSLIG